MKSYESPDFFPSYLANDGLQPVDVRVFSDLQRIPYDQSLRLVQDFGLTGTHFETLQEQILREQHVFLERQDVAYLLIDSKFVNRLGAEAPFPEHLETIRAKLRNKRNK